MFGLILLFVGIPTAKADNLMRIAQEELNRTQKFLFAQEEPAYWVGLNISDSFEEIIRVEDGGAFPIEDSHQRYADIDVRVGDISFDNTHPLRDSSLFGEDVHFGTWLPIEDKQQAIQSILWQEFDRAYRHSLRRLTKLRSNDAIKVEMEDKSADFSLYPAQKELLPLHDHHLTPEQRQYWTRELKNHSIDLAEGVEILSSGLRLHVERVDSYILNTEGTRIRNQRIHYRLSVYARTKADDGMDIQVYDYVDAHSLDRLPTTEKIASMVQKSREKLFALRAAPVVEPYVGPAILRGRAAAVFFHEILGHRIEGHRQKDEQEGQTLAGKVGEEIVPTFISISDNPSLSQWNDVDLNGYYRYDDEGSKGQDVSIVEDGILKAFVMSRAPIEGFSQSNGHGRREPGEAVVARQGNLIISASTTVSYEELRQSLKKEIQEQGKPFGLIFDDISGGFTFTGRNSPNSYSVQPVTVWKVYAQERPDELVRGVDLIGTPLLTFGRIMQASNSTQVFNGICGAESGYVPVSAIAPDMLIKEVEVQRKEKDVDLPPIIEAPRGVQ